MIFTLVVFPDRIGRVIIDGVVNTDLWANHLSYQAWPCMSLPFFRLSTSPR